MVGMEKTEEKVDEEVDEKMEWGKGGSLCVSGRENLFLFFFYSRLGSSARR